MVFSARLEFSLTLIALFSAGHVAGLQCGGNRPLSMCCLGVAPFSSNAAVWGGICGYHPSSPDEIVGGRCIPSDSCPQGSIPLCCQGFFPGQCSLGTNCGSPPPPSPPPLPPIQPAPIPAGWTTDFACSSDSTPRVLANAVVTQLGANTPGTCINRCLSQGYIYAGVENGNECICGTGYKAAPAPAAIDAANCSARCSGGNAFTCGGAWAIQLYHGPAPSDSFPPGWAPVDACAVDTPGRVLTDVVTTRHSDNTPGRCAAHCAKKGYDYAGVEYGNECHCGNGVEPHDSAPKAECDMPCSGSLGLYCGASWRIQIYGKEPVA